MKHHPIAIIGGGISGLLLARLLHLANIDFTVFERDESVTARGQGGTLDMHADTGQYALRQAKLFDEFKKVARYQHQGIRLYDEQATLLFDHNNNVHNNDVNVNQHSQLNDDSRPEIDRGLLRSLLLNSFPDKHMAWNHHTKALTPLNNGQTQIDFNNQPSVTADFVVGADGVWSKVRPLLSPYQPQYVGTTFFDLTIKNIAEKHPQLAKLVGNGMCLAGFNRETENTAHNQQLVIQLNGDGNARVYARLWLDLDEVKTMDKAKIKSYYQGWSEQLLNSIDVAEDSINPWVIYTLPEDHEWQHHPHMTLIGDAAHLMPPSGEGANLAMKDAADLAQALILTEQTQRDKAIQAFEKQMFARSHVSAKESLTAMAADRSGLGITYLLHAFTSTSVN